MNFDRTTNDAQPSLRAYIDGGARGNPGPAGVGVYLEIDGSPWRGLYEFLGSKTNNYAEYSALLKALRFVRSKQFNKLDVFSDSELLVKQIRGEYRVKSPILAPLYHEAVALIRDFDSFSIHHIPRKKNRRADALVNKAQDLCQCGVEAYSA